MTVTHKCQHARQRPADHSLQIDVETFRVRRLVSHTMGWLSKDESSQARKIHGNVIHFKWLKNSLWRTQARGMNVTITFPLEMILSMRLYCLLCASSLQMLDRSQ